MPQSDFIHEGMLFKCDCSSPKLMDSRNIGKFPKKLVRTASGEACHLFKVEHEVMLPVVLSTSEGLILVKSDSKVLVFIGFLIVYLHCCGRNN